MTTDQIKRTGGTVETDSDDATTEAAAVLEAAQADAKQILAKARYEAFRMVTDARSEAESILSEAELTAPVAVSGEVDTAEAEEAAELIVTAAEEKAAGIIKEAEVQATRLYETSRASVEQQTAVLRERHERLEAQVASTQALLTDLEKRLAQIAAPSAPNPTPRTTPPAYSLAGETEPTDAKPVQRLNSADGSDPLPPAASGDHDRPVSMIPASATVTAAPAEQGSFYTRRSANLPSIGSAGGQDAMSAVRSMRSKMEHDGR